MRLTIPYNWWDESQVVKNRENLNGVDGRPLPCGRGLFCLPYEHKRSGTVAVPAPIAMLAIESRNLLHEDDKEKGKGKVQMRLQSIGTCFFSILLLWGLAGNAESSWLQPKTQIVQGTMQYVTVEGGCWVLVSDSGKKYELIGRHPQLEREGLRVVVLLSKPDQPVYGFCPGEKMKLVQVVRIH